jgi:hypothetical protein
MSSFLDGGPAASPSAQAKAQATPELRCVRESVLDPYLPSEPELAPCVYMPNVSVLYLLGRPVAIVRATRMDQVSLDRWLVRIRSHLPRVPLDLGTPCS